MTTSPTTGMARYGQAKVRVRRPWTIIDTAMAAASAAQIHSSLTDSSTATQAPRARRIPPAQAGRRLAAATTSTSASTSPRHNPTRRALTSNCLRATERLASLIWKVSR